VLPGLVFQAVLSRGDYDSIQKLVCTLSPKFQKLPEMQFNALFEADKT
jgi:hypothetical protein